MTLDWQAVIGGIALLISLLLAFSKQIDKSLSVREHEEFKGRTEENLRALRDGQGANLTIREFQEWRKQIDRDFDRLGEALQHLDRDKPSRDTLEAALRAVDARVATLEERIKPLASQ